MAGESQNQLNIALRYVGTAAGTLFTLLGALQFVTPDQIAQLTSAVHDLNASIITGYGAITKMGIILGPAAVTALTVLGVKSGSISAMGLKLLTMAKSKLPEAVEAKNTLVASTIALNEVKTIVADKATAAAATSPDVVTAEQVKMVVKK